MPIDLNHCRMSRTGLFLGIPSANTVIPMTDSSAVIFEKFRQLLTEAGAAGDPEPTAMTLASADSDGRLSARVVLLKALDERGFVFYTNTHSNKGRQLLSNPRAALNFLWKPLRHQVQVSIEGGVECVSAAEADAYFASRPRLSQLGAWASDQSATLGSRAELLARVDEVTARFADAPVPRPPHWSGFRLLPEMIEFWFGEPGRLHVRERHELHDGQWRLRLLNP
jgi:pyridoxamine 5'-phosphate oxidase